MLCIHAWQEARRSMWRTCSGCGLLMQRCLAPARALFSVTPSWPAAGLQMVRGHSELALLGTGSDCAQCKPLQGRLRAEKAIDLQVAAAHLS